ncbi:uncharacterized protein nbs [Panulirus ornatus]|uniref:uncharacterized protein nbs n=1 Tax=Panulirus ornatus TaxID=150431 RepID=UPI003A876357
MWTLEGNPNVPDKKHYLPCGSSLIVSRREGHILLQGDNSISRQHAAIFINHSPANLKNVQAQPQVMLTELRAKYGTFLNDGIQNDKKIQENSRVELKNGDVVRFGMLTNTWRLVYRPLVVTTSTLQPDKKIVLTDTLLKLGGHLVGEWNAACSYLVMNSITLTIKVVCALAGGRHIVTPEFFTKLLDAVMNKTPHPNADEFQPPLQVNSAFMNVQIQNYLQGFLKKPTRCTYSKTMANSQKGLKTFTETYFIVTQILFVSIGGIAEELTADNYRLATSSNYLLVQVTSDKNQGPQNSTLFESAFELLQANGLRAIPESDIGLAVLYASTEGHCNPAFKVSSILRRTESTSQMTEGLKIFATETQETEENSLCLTGTRVVPETGQSSTAKRTSPAIMSSSSSRVPNSLPSSSSTNAFPSASLNQSMTSRSKIEDKENMSNNARKRPHTVSEESGSPLAKRSNKPQLSQPCQDPPDPTQPVDSQEECDDSQLSGSEFKPQVRSTHKENTAFPGTTVDVHPSKPVSVVDREVVNGTSVSTSVSSDQSTDQTVGRSIPFEPYTLPSLKTETLRDDDVLTQPFAPVKREPGSHEEDDRILEVLDCHRGKRRREEPMEVVSDEDTTLWHDSKKTRTENMNTRSIKAERISGTASTLGQVDQRHKNSGSKIKQEQEEESRFALPTSAVRGQRRANDQSSGLTEGNNTDFDADKPSSDSDPFALPPSARSERRKRQFEKKSEMVKLPKESRMESDQRTTVSSDNAQGTTGLQEGQQKLIIASEGSFLSKRACTIKKSPSEQEAAATSGVPSQLMPKQGDIAELTGVLEKSLVVVEVASLVKKPVMSKRTDAEDSHNQTSSGLKNYKRFRKSSSDITSLPRIIGGRELVSHDVAQNANRDAWLLEHRDLTSMLDERDAQKHGGHSSKADDLFDLPMLPKNRVRMRR